MHIELVEIRNFRKLKSTRVEFAEKTTLFVGANNSGKTSAMVALGHFLVDPKRFTINDFTLSNWASINKIGTAWEAKSTEQEAEHLSLIEWGDVLPSIDIWLQIAQNEIHYVSHLLPTLDWEGGYLGVRLQLEPKDIEQLHKDYLFSRKAAQETLDEIKTEKPDSEYTVALWPTDMRDFLERRLSSLFTIRAYSLDPKNPDCLPPESDPIDGDPLKGLVRIDEINAQRGFSDAIGKRDRTERGSENGVEHDDTRRLSSQLRDYYAKHLDPSEAPEPSDVDALQAIHEAQSKFDKKLREGFSAPLSEVETLGYPGVTNPKLTISTKIRPTDGLSHPSAVQYEVIQQSPECEENALRLAEQYNGLGYQNLISIAFRLMAFRDHWMQVGKVAKKSELNSRESFSPPPLHLVLVEEPEAHLHAQVQQVFIRQAYKILRAHDDLGDKESMTTQLIVSTHSSHIAHECEFSCLRYFRREPAVDIGDVPTSTVINLSETFGKKEKTQQFVTRYLKAGHCDLFFADAAIVLEGPAERMLVPHFIRQHFEKLNERYITLLEIGGSHAHRLRDLIEHLGLITLIITDLDAAENLENRPTIQPSREKKYITRNETIRKWIPEKEHVDVLIDLNDEQKIKKYDNFFSVRVAYQIPIQIKINNESSESEALSNTFEDALAFENLEFFRSLEGSGLIKKFREAILASNTAAELGLQMFDALKGGDKAKFALDLLYQADPLKLGVPTYILKGLSWLQDQLLTKEREAPPPSEALAAIIHRGFDIGVNFRTPSVIAAV